MKGIKQDALSVFFLSSFNSEKAFFMLHAAIFLQHLTLKKLYYATQKHLLYLANFFCHKLGYDMTKYGLIEREL